MRSKRLYNLGFQDGVDDSDNTEPNMASEIAQDQTNARAISFGQYYLDGYEAGYKEASGKTWYVVSLDKETKRVKNYYVQLEHGNAWAEDRKDATKFRNKKVVYEELNNILSNLGRGEYGVIWGEKCSI
jgi:hypothetical protein